MLAIIRDILIGTSALLIFVHFISMFVGLYTGNKMLKILEIDRFELERRGKEFGPIGVSTLIYEALLEKNKLFVYKLKRILRLAGAYIIVSHSRIFAACAVIDSEEQIDACLQKISMDEKTMIIFPFKVSIFIKKETGEARFIKQEVEVMGKSLAWVTELLAETKERKEKRKIRYCV